jgi:hypothetical protein
MQLREVMAVFSRQGNKMVRKYRCTSGARKGRIVADPETCVAPMNIKKSMTMQKTRGTKGKRAAIKSRITKRSNQFSKRLKRLNVRRTVPSRPGGKFRRR